MVDLSARAQALLDQLLGFKDGPAHDETLKVLRSVRRNAFDDLRTRDIAHNIVVSLLEDLTDRRGFRQEWDQVDDEVRAEIKSEWCALVTTLLEAALLEVSEAPELRP